MISALQATLVADVLDALVLEDYAGLRSRVTAAGVLTLPDGTSLRSEPAYRLLARRRFVPDRAVGLASLFAALAAWGSAADDLAGFEVECRAELAARELRQSRRSVVLDRVLLEEPSLGPGTVFETLAALRPHPVHPTSLARPGLHSRQLLAYAPEYFPVFALRWASVPDGVVVGTPPPWWPEHAQVGLPDDGAPLFPVHPLMADQVPGLAPLPYLHVGPTLSMRTVVVLAAPGVHLKLPLPTSTLGLRNRRTIVPRTLHDGALVQRLLGPLLPGTLLADEQTYGHAGASLAYLVRRYPAATLGARVLPVAALAAPAPGGGTVIETLTDDPAGLFARYLAALFALNVPLLTRHGVALETHQQNLCLVLPPADRPPRQPAGGRSPRLLVKDNDGPLLHPGLPGADALLDRRLVSTDREALARVFVTITLHLAAAGIAFALADEGVLPLRTGLGLVRDRLAEALDREGAAAAFLRSRTLDAPLLPTKAMVTAGTLVPKSRTGASDINKHYGPPAPNYLRGHTP